MAWHPERVWLARLTRSSSPAPLHQSCSCFTCLFVVQHAALQLEKQFSALSPLDPLKWGSQESAQSSALLDQQQNMFSKPASITQQREQTAAAFARAWVHVPLADESLPFFSSSCPSALCCACCRLSLWQTSNAWPTVRTMRMAWLWQINESKERNSFILWTKSASLSRCPPVLRRVNSLSSFFLEILSL